MDDATRSAARPTGLGGRAGPRLVRAAVMFVVAAMILVPRTAALVDVPDPWVDEAMLTWNFLAGSWTGLLQPQPYYEQATSLGHLVAGRLAATFAPGQIVLVMRAFSAAVSLFAAGLLFLLYRRAWPPVQAALTVLAVMMAPTVIFQSVEIKPYVLDLCAAAGILLAGMNAQAQGASRRSLAIFIAVSCAAMVFSNPAALVVGGVGTSLFLWALAERPWNRAQLLRIVAAGAAVGAWGALLYLGYTHPATRIQLADWASYFDGATLPLPFSRDDWVGPWLVFTRMLRASFLYEAGGGLFSPGYLFYALAALGAVAALRSRTGAARFIATAGMLVIGFVVLAGVARIYAAPVERLLLFTTPIMGYFVVGGVVALASLAARAAPPQFRASAAATIATAAILAYGGYQLARETNPAREPMRPALQALAAAGDWPAKTWVYYAAEPVVDVLTFPRREAYLGRVEIRSLLVPEGWIYVPRRTFPAYLQRFRRSAAGRSEIYILMSHFRMTHGDEAVALENAAQSLVGPCRVVLTTEGNRGAVELVRCAKDQATPSPSAAHLHRMDGRPAGLEVEGG